MDDWDDGGSQALDGLQRVPGQAMETSSRWGLRTARPSHHPERRSTLQTSNPGATAMRPTVEVVELPEIAVPPEPAVGVTETPPAVVPERPPIVGPSSRTLGW